MKKNDEDEKQKDKTFQVNEEQIKKRRPCEITEIIYEKINKIKN